MSWVVNILEGKLAKHPSSMGEIQRDTEIRVITAVHLAPFG